MLCDINFMIKISDEEFTPLRRYEIAQALQQIQTILENKFSHEFETKRHEVDWVNLYLSQDLQTLQEVLDENLPKKKSEECKSEPIKKSAKIDEKDMNLSPEDLLKFELILEFKNRNSFLKYFQKKQVQKYMKYLIGVRCMVDSISKYGFEVAKHFFLNQTDSACYSNYAAISQVPSSQSPSQEVSPFNANPSNCEIKVGDQSLKVVSIEQTIQTLC